MITIGAIYSLQVITIDGVVKTLHLLRHCKFNVITTYSSTSHSIKFAFLECEVFYLAIPKFTFYDASTINFLEELSW